MADMIFEGVLLFDYEDSHTHLVGELVTDEDFADPIDYSRGDVPLPIRNYVAITSENEVTKDHTSLMALARKRVRITVEALRDLTAEEIAAYTTAWTVAEVDPRLDVVHGSEQFDYFEVDDPHNPGFFWARKGAQWYRGQVANKFDRYSIGTHGTRRTDEVPREVVARDAATWQ